MSDDIDRAYGLGHHEGYLAGQLAGDDGRYRRWTSGDLVLVLIACFVAYVLGSGVR